MKHMVKGFVCLAFAAGMSFAASAATTTVNNWSELLAAVSTASDGDVIILAAGDYTVVDSGVTLSHGVTVRGATGDPAGVTITDAVSGKRAFTLEHPDARIEALTITGSGLGGGVGAQHGGHLNLSAGTVSNCVIKGGKVSLSGNTTGGRGGNVYMTGGVIEDSILRSGSVGRQGCGGNVYMEEGGTVRRCRILEGVGYSDAGNQDNYNAVGAGVYAKAGLIDSCLLKDNKVTRNGYCGGMYLEGTVTAVNCTVVGSRVDETVHPSNKRLNFGYGVHIGSANAKAVNTVMYDNGGDAQKEYGTANFGNYINCASSVDNTSGAGWQTIGVDDFADYRNGNYMPKTSKLIDKGTTDSAYYPDESSKTDLAGNPRISGNEIDIGCYEADQSKASCSGSLSEYAVLEGAQVLCSAEVVGLDGDIIYKWDFGNGTIVTTNLADFAYAYPNAGLFTVSVAASGDEGETWTAPFELPTKIVVAPSVMYVDSESESPTIPYKGKGSAAKTITAVLNVMTNNISKGLACVPGVEIRIVSGSRLTDSGMVLDAPIIIRGESDNPTNVVITASARGKRAFTLNHEEALIENLTVSGSGAVSVDGGHVLVSKGVVRNCIIENAQGATGVSDAGKRGVNVFVEGGIVEDSVIRGATKGFKTFGGNVAMVGGCVRRCKILNGTAYSGAGTGGYESRGGGVYMTGGVLENCLVASNVVGRFSYTAGIYLDGAGTVVNCTVVGGTVDYGTKEPGSSSSYGVGIHIANSAGRVINTVVYDNGGTAQKEFGTTCLGCYDYCASSVENGDAAHWTVMTDADFADWNGWVADGDINGLRPNEGDVHSKLLNAGQKKNDYLAMDGLSLTDLLGGKRINGRYLDIGCFEGVKNPGLILLFK